MILDERDPALISILLPLYNEENFLRETLAGILSQRYANIEILIGDNFSTDKTFEICQKIMGKDKRASIFRHSENIGAAGNHIFLLNKAKGKYIIFAAGHDRWSDNYIAENVKAIEGSPNAVIAYGTPCWIDQNGKIFDRHSGWYDTRGLTVISRFFTVFWGKPNPILGLIRRDCLPPLDGYKFAGADNVLLCNFALQGEFIHTSNTTFYRRQNRGQESHEQRLKRYKNNEMKISTSVFQKLFPLLRLPFELFKTVAFSSLSFPEKVLISLLLIPSMLVKYLTEKSANR